MKAKFVIGFIAVFVCAGALLFAHGRSDRSIPAVEVNALFDSADADKDGVISKAEFEKYLVRMKTVSASTVKNASKENVRICPTTGAPCTGGGEGCGGGGCGGGGGGCCSDKSMGAKTVPVKSTTVTESGEKKAGGCCGGKAKAEGAEKAGGCCGGKAKAEGAEKAGGCCGGKAKAEGAEKAGGCCGGKAKAEGAEKTGGCCGGKAKTETPVAETVEAETK